MAGRCTHVGLTPASSVGTVVTAHATPNTMGNWAQLSASTPHAAEAVLVSVWGAGSFDGVLLNLGLGAASAEQIIAPAIAYSVPRLSGGLTSVVVPVHVPAGSRLAAQCQSYIGGTAVLVSALLIEHWDSPPRRGPLQSIGADAANSLGTLVDPGGVAHAKGAWTQLVASLAAPVRRAQMFVTLGGNSAATTATWMLRVARGAGGSEQVIVPEIVVTADNFGDQLHVAAIDLPPLDLVTGERVAVDAQCSIVDATDRLIYVNLLGASG